MTIIPHANTYAFMTGCALSVAWVEAEQLAINVFCKNYPNHIKKIERIFLAHGITAIIACTYGAIRAKWICTELGIPAGLIALTYLFLRHYENVQFRINQQQQAQQAPANPQQQQMQQVQAFQAAWFRYWQDFFFNFNNRIEKG